MAALQAHLNKLREERLAREKARIEKLRELNLKKYSKTETSVLRTPTASKPKIDVKRNTSIVQNNLHVNDTSKRPITTPADRKSVAASSNYTSSNTTKYEKKDDNIRNKMNVKSNLTAKNNNVKSLTAKNDHVKSLLAKIKNAKSSTSKNNDGKILTVKTNDVANESSLYKIAENETINVFTIEKKSDNALDLSKKPSPINRNLNIVPNNLKKDFISSNKIIVKKMNSETSIRKSFAPSVDAFRGNTLSRKSLQAPKITQSATKIDPKRQSVFERLYKPKVIPKKVESETEKLHNDPDFLKKVIKNTGLILNNGKTMQGNKNSLQRRSISAVHLKRVSRNEVMNYNHVHKWSSVGEKLNKMHLKDEDASVKEDKIVLPVKSERKHVKFMTPLSNLNTPKHEELQAKLKSWLHKRGKSLDSYQHLQCFGIHHLSKDVKPLNVEASKFDDGASRSDNEALRFDDGAERFENGAERFYDEDEDKENVPMESDSDDDSFHEIMNDADVDENVDQKIEKGEGDEKINFSDNKWRRASCVSDSVDFNDTCDTTLTSTECPVDDMVAGALKDLNELLTEGYSWEQCARWLRCVRERYPAALNTAAYWECRAQLEARRGDLPAAAYCWEEAHAHRHMQQGDFSSLEQNLDQLLDKFMHLKISPACAGLRGSAGGARKQPDPKFVDMKNVFKSTLIKFAVQQAKRRSVDPKLIVTPVRRSGRLSSVGAGLRTPLLKYSARKGARTPLLECSTVREAEMIHTPLHFVPNHNMPQTP